MDAHPVLSQRWQRLRNVTAVHAAAADCAAGGTASRPATSTSDGRPDLVAGNLGLNYTLHDVEGQPVRRLRRRLHREPDTDIVLTQEIGGKEYPLAGMVPLGREIYPLALRFPTYGAFADGDRCRQLFGPAQLRRRDPLSGRHVRERLSAQRRWRRVQRRPRFPTLAQIAPIKAIVAHDVDGDGHLDSIVAGNLYDAEPNTPRADAGNGLWLRGDGRATSLPVPPRESGFLAPLNVAGLALINTRPARRCSSPTPAIHFRRSRSGSAGRPARPVAAK